MKNLEAYFSGDIATTHDAALLVNAKHRTDSENDVQSNKDSFKSPLEQIHSHNQSMSQIFSLKREWIADASRLRYHKGNRCISKIRRGLMGGDYQVTPDVDDVSVQQVHILCFNAGSTVDDGSSTEASSTHMELIIPAFHGMEFIEDVSFLDDQLDLPMDHGVDDSQEASPQSDYFCLYLLTRQDLYVYRGYCVEKSNLRQYWRRVDKTSAATPWDSPLNTKMHEVTQREGATDRSSKQTWTAVKGPRRAHELSAQYFLSNPISIMTFRNGTQANALILSQHIQKDVLRSRLIGSDSSDIDVTSYTLTDPSSLSPKEGEPDRVSLGFIGVPPLVQYFLSGTLRDEVYRLQPLLSTCTPHQTSCVFSFLFGLFLSIDLPVTKNATTLQENVEFTISVVDYRHHTPDVNLESIFGQRLIFKRDWLPPVMRMSNDASRVALADVQHRRVILFKKTVDVLDEGPYEAYAEIFERSKSQAQGRFQITHEDENDRPRDLILDVQFIEVAQGEERSSEIMIQILYSGPLGRYSRFYSLNPETTTIMAWLFADLVDYVKSKWNLLFTIAVLTAVYIINEVAIWKKHQDQRAARQREQDYEATRSPG